MKIPLRLVFKNLAKHKVRSVLTVASLFVALFLLCLLRALVVSLDIGVRNAKSDRIIVQSAVSLFVDLPQSYKPQIQQLPGVKDVNSWNWFGGIYKEPKNMFAQFAVDHANLLAMYPEIEIVEGSAKAFQDDRQGCIVGRGLMQRFREWKLGDIVPLIGTIYPRVNGNEAWQVRIEGIYRSNSGNVDENTMFFHYDYVREAQETKAALGPEGVGLYVVQVAPGQSPVGLMKEIDARFANGDQRVQSTSEAEFQAQFVSMVGNVPFFVAMIGGGVFLAILLAVINTMLMAAREQTRDAGILKALGFTSATVGILMLLQSLGLAALGGGLGIGLAKLSEALLRSLLGVMFPGYEVTHGIMLEGAVITLLLGLVAGIVPAIRMARLRAVSALRQEV